MRNHNSLISIIVPCYNQAQYLDECLDSVIKQSYQDWECIIVNDGSPDNTEELALSWVKKDSRFKYFFKENEGLCKTRNYGIVRAKGIYILPLDCDNQLIKDFIEDSVSVLDKNKDIGVVHGNAEFMGEKTGIWKIGEFRIETMLIDNYIDACAVYRKILWENIGGYDENLPFKGLEDWDLWLAFGSINVEFFHLQKITFKYRVSKNSMISLFSYEMAETTREYVSKKYSSLYRYHYLKFYRESIRLKNKLNSKRFVLYVFFKKILGVEVFKLKS